MSGVIEPLWVDGATNDGATDDGLRTMLHSVANGDTEAFGLLYDQLALASYAVCAMLGRPNEDSAMRNTWLFVWANAAALLGLGLPTRTLILDIAGEMAARSRS